MTPRTLVLLALAVAPCAVAQEKPAAPPPPPAAAKSFDLGVQIRLRGDATRDLDLAEESDDRDAWVLSRIRLFGTFRRGEKLAAHVELQDSRAFGSEASATSNERNVDLHQGWLRVGDAKDFLRLGRQEIAFGEQRLVGSFDWDNVGRSFDGALGRVTFEKVPVVVDAFWAKVKESSGPPERSDVDFSGVHATWKSIPGIDLDTYVFVLRSGARDAAGDDRLVTTIGARGHGSHGRLVWDAEGAIQTGHEFALDRRAWAVAGWIRYELPLPLKPSFGLEASKATGDGDPLDGRFEEFDNLFPTNHLKYGYLDLTGWRNQRVVSLSAGVAGESVKWTARLFCRALALDDPAGAWKAAGGAVLGLDATGSSGRSIGTELDVVGTYPILPGLTGQLQAGWFRPGDYAKAVRGDDDALGASASLLFVF
ncbi:MAG TPA: alginate export family protein [Thermoanaerobaculia bacterium]|nr:alginate export family protein [Thermoanaerobaculia bacterium]